MTVFNKNFPINKHYGNPQSYASQPADNLWLTFRDLYKIAIDHSRDAFALLKPVYKNNKITNFTIVDVNQELLLDINRTRDQVIGLNVLDLFPILRQPDLFPKFAEAFEKHVTYAHQYEIAESESHPYGTYRVEVYPLDGSLAMININLTKMIMADKQIVELHFERERVKLLQGFIRDAGHDIRTPLTVIGTSMYLAEKEQGIDKFKERMDTVRSQIKHINAIIEDLVRLTYWKQDATYSSMKIIHVNPMIAKIAADMQLIAATKRQTVTMTLNDDCTSLIDEEKMYRAITNIVKNAITYTNEGGTIALSTRQEGDYIKIEVTDNGIGISTENLDKIFDQFYRVDSNRTGLDGNSGLGLTIARQIIESHAGMVTVESKVGEGSKFIITLSNFADNLQNLM